MSLFNFKGKWLPKSGKYARLGRGQWSWMKAQECKFFRGHNFLDGRIFYRDTKPEYLMCEHCGLEMKI